MENGKRASLKRPGSASRLKYGEPAPLNLGRKIFLSHSGNDKNFVRFLNTELRRHYKHDDKITFFDEEDLPIAEPISMDNILKEAEESELGVLVLTRDFFVKTPNPMRELEVLVTRQVRLLPLFFTLSVDDVKDTIQRAEWEEQWRKWPLVQADEGVFYSWRDALDHVFTFSGLEFCKIATNWPEYINKIVNEVIHILPPRYLSKGFAGMDRMCQIVNGMYEECASKTSADGCGYTLDLVGIYGFAGLGKTTLCYGLCDLYLSEFKGKVCHVDLGSKPCEKTSSETYCEQAYFERMKHMLSNLTDSKYHEHRSLQFSRLQDMLSITITEPVFLAIDNILPDEASQDEAKFYLSLKFPKGSKIFITSRSRDILEKLTSWCSSFSVVIRHIPKLEFEEARDILLHEIPLKMCNFRSTNVEDEVEACVKICIIYEEESEHYHPLMLESLVAFLKHDGMQNLERNLAEIRSEGISYKNDKVLETIFKVLDKSYKILSKDEKSMFLDLALFYTIAGSHYKIKEWIERVYSHLDSNKLLSNLGNFTFIRIIRWTDQNIWSIQIHDVLVEFAKHKVSQEGNYLVVEDSTHWPRYILANYRNVSISGCGMINGKARVLDLRDVEGVEVLHLVHNAGLHEVLLSLTTWSRLRSLIVRVPRGSLLLCTVDEAAGQRRRGDGGPMWCELQGNVVFTSRREGTGRRLWSRNPLASLANHLGNLEVLSLQGLPALEGINLISSCATVRLKDVTLCDLPSLSFISGLDKSTNLQTLHVSYCGKLRFISGLDKSTNLQTLAVSSCEELQGIDLSSCADVSLYDLPSLSFISGLDKSTNLQTLDVAYCGKLRFIPGLDKSTNLGNLNIETCGELQELTIRPHLEFSSHIHNCKSFRRIAICPTPCIHPEVRDLASIDQWHLLQHLDLSWCTSVEEWPDFATMTSLQHLDLSYTSLKEWPAGVQFLPDLEYLDIRGCGQLPAEEFIKVIIQQRTNYKWPSLAGTLIDDLQAERRDRCSVVDALDSHYPELMNLFCHFRLSWLHFTTELLFLVNLLYELWFGEVDDWSRASTQYDREGSPPTLNKMRRLLCNGIFMSLSFYLLSTSTIDRFDKILGPNMVTKRCYISFGLMAVALVGVGSIGWYNAPVNNHDIIAFVKWYFNYEELEESTQYYPKMNWGPHWFVMKKDGARLRRRRAWCMGQKSPEETVWFQERVGLAVCRMARVPSVAAELGEDFIKDHVEASYALESDGFEEDYLTDY